MMSWDTFVISNGFHVQKKTMLGIPLVDIDMPGTRAIGRAFGIIRRNCIFGAGCFHRYGEQLAFWQEAKKFWKVWFHTRKVMVLKVEKLLPRSGLKPVLIFNGLVKGGEISKPSLCATASIS